MQAALHLALAAGLLAAAGLMAHVALRRLSPTAERVRRLARAGAPDPPPWHAHLLDHLARLARATPAAEQMDRTLADQLVAADLRGPRALPLYRLAGLAMPLVGAAIGFLAAPLLVTAPDTATRGLVALGGALAGRAAPGLWVRNRWERRRTLLERTLPEALDLLLICVEAGLSIDAALARIGRELAPTAPALAAELQLTAIELGFLPGRADAWRSLERRAPLAAITALVDLFQQTERYGTPLGQPLRVMADDLRHAALMAVEERGARLPALLTVPMVAFILPPLFIVLLGPAILQLLAL